MVDCLKQKHKILNLDDAEDGNLINTSDEDKTTDEEKKAHSITAILEFRKAKLLFKTLVITDVFFYCFSVKKCCLIFVTNAVCSVTKV
ncbi:putative replication initiation protein Rep domain protein [Staphylococcus aureus]|nr:putative replication initiation protein Rep domain protein [Staphylococcus aureus]